MFELKSADSLINYLAQIINFHLMLSFYHFAHFLLNNYKN